MVKQPKSKNHHWWPVGLQSYWSDKKGDVSWLDPDGKIEKKRAVGRKIGYKIHGHTVFRGSAWETNFENEFEIDNNVHTIIGSLQGLKPLGRTPSEFIGMIKLLFKRDRTLRDMCKFYQLDEQLHRKLLLFILSLLLRSPSNRSNYERYPETFGLPPDEEVGKINIAQNYKVAKKICESGST